MESLLLCDEPVTTGVPKTTVSGPTLTRKTPSDAFIQSVTEVYERGQTIDALKRAVEFAPLKDWDGVRGCCLAARIAMNAGGLRLSARLAARMWHTEKGHPLSQLEYGFQLLQHRGPLAFWLAARSWPATADGDSTWLGDLFALKARVAIELREFTVAEQLISHAESLAPAAPWVRLQHAFLLERLEKVEEALELASAACKLHPHPFYRPGVQSVAYLLQLLDRDAEAIELLRQADAALQSGPLAIQLHGLLSDMQQWAEAERYLERYAALSPLIEPAATLWLQSRRARMAYHLGKRSEALGYAKELKDPFNRQFAEKLAQPAPAMEQMRLDVPFVRQHFKTCAPATLAALGRFWKTPAEHLAQVQAICYDGTPSWLQRDWAERNGWLVREFRVTWGSALALLTRGIPFAITIVEATAGHMQAVIGFDQTQGVLLLRDPSQPYCLEVHAEVYLERYRPFGPRGMVFIPLAEAARLKDACLPDAELYDEYHALSLALSKYDREKAQAALAQLESKWPDDALTAEARLALMAYDTNTAEEIRCLDRLLELYPNNPARLLGRLACMKDASREERIEFLEKACANKTSDPALFIDLARNLLVDAPRQPAAENWLRRAMRKRQVDSGVMAALAELRWSRGQFGEATELFRFAATSEGYREPLYQTWFSACRQVRQTDAALVHLEDRFKRFGSRSSQPALTLAWALCEIEQPDRARSILTEAIRMRPDDGYLMIRTATINARLGANGQSETLLNSARGKVRQNDWLRTAAELGERRFDAKAGLQFCREILALEPLAVDAHGGVARALAHLEGHAAAVAHIKDACARHPNHCGLRRLLVEWSRGIGFEAVAIAAREFLIISPRNAWTRRELAWALANLNQPEEALAEAEEARRIEPRNSASAGLLGHVHERFRHPLEARQHFREAVALSVDNSGAIAGLLRLANTDKERKEELVFLEQELVRQVVRGDGLLAFFEAARPVIESDALLKFLREGHAERPDLWQTWSALIIQLDHLGKLDEALPLARTATERFPHLPRTWLELANIHRRRNEVDEEIAAAERGFEINPAWNRGAAALAGALERHRSLNEAKVVYERALRHASSDAQLHAQMASVLWRLRQPKEALASLETALRLQSHADWAWNLLITWSRECGRPERPVDFARDLTRERPGDVYGWLMLARVLLDAGELANRLKAVDRALELDPHLLEAWDFKAELLAGVLQFDAAIEACDQGAAACSTSSFLLRGRKAWIEAQRGKLPDAIGQMRAVLADNAGYAWGWQQMAVWLTSQQSFAFAEEAIGQLLKLQPQNTWAQRQLAVVRLKQDDKAGAQKVFSAVFDASPTDRSAAENLFNLQLEIGNLVGAEETLRRMQTHLPGARTLAREVILSARKGNQSAALKLFEALCVQPDPDPWPVSASVDALKKAGLEGKTFRVLKRSLMSDACNPQAGAAAIQFLIDRRRAWRAVWMFSRIRSAQARTGAAAPLAQSLGKLNARLPLRVLLRRHRELFFKNDGAWGQVGYALAKFGRAGAVAEWMADWRSRPSAEPWMLFNLCCALRNRGRYPEANEIAEYAVQKWGYRKQDGADLRLFLAVEKALAGSTGEAMEHLARVHVRDQILHDRQLLAITRALIEFQQSPPETRRKQFKAVCRQHLELFFSARKVTKSGRDVRRTFRRAAKVFVQNGAGLGADMWFLWKLNWQWFLIPLVPCLLLSGCLPLGALGILFLGMVLLGMAFSALVRRGIGRKI